MTPCRAKNATSALSCVRSSAALSCDSRSLKFMSLSYNGERKGNHPALNQFQDTRRGRTWRTVFATCGRFGREGQCCDAAPTLNDVPQ